MIARRKRPTVPPARDCFPPAPYNGQIINSGETAAIIIVRKGGAGYVMDVQVRMPSAELLPILVELVERVRADEEAGL